MTLGRKLISIVILLVLLVGTCITYQPVQAAQSCSIAIIPVTVEDNTTIIKGHSFELFQVATVDHGVYRLTDGFTELDADLTSWEADELSETITQYLTTHDVSGITKTADSAGVVAFNDLSIGLYYVAQNNTISGYDTVVPFMVTLPYKAPDGTGYTYDVKAYPKVEPNEDQPEDPDQPTNPETPNQPDDEDDPGTTPGGENTPGSTTGGGSTGGGSAVSGGTTSGGKTNGTSTGSPISNVVDTVQETLAQTGALIWPIIFLSGFGLILLLTGIYSVRKQKKSSEKGDAKP